MQYTLLWLLAVITNFMSHQKISLDSILVPSTHCSAETFCSELKRQHYHGTNSNNIQSCWISREIHGENYFLLSSQGHSLLPGTSYITIASILSKGRQTCVKPSPPSFRLFLKIWSVAISSNSPHAKWAWSVAAACSWQQKLQLSSALQPTWKQANHLRLSGPPYSPHGRDQEIRTGADMGDISALLRAGIL